MTTVDDITTPPTIEDVLLSTRVLDAILSTTESRYPNKTKEIREAAALFADLVSEADDPESAAIALYAVGSIMAYVATTLSKERDSKVDDVLAKYGLSLGYAAYLILN
jgi:hypothetical protein